jgi:hypothetical protein
MRPTRNSFGAEDTLTTLTYLVLAGVLFTAFVAPFMS